jgi:hypothetical protein
MHSRFLLAVGLTAGLCAACGEHGTKQNAQSANAEEQEPAPVEDGSKPDEDRDEPSGESAPPPSAIDAGAPHVDAASNAKLITYAEQVRPILARSCVPCHSQGQIAPFSLESYERAKPFSSLIAKATRARTMPPSVIDNSGSCHTFRDVPWLTDDEITLLERWHQDGAPEGDTSLPAPPVKQLPKLTGDVKTIRTPGYVPSTELPDDWRCFVIDSPFTEKTFITGFDTIPGDQKTAHHMVVFYPMDDGSGLISRVLDQLEEGPGYTCFGSPGVPATILAAWAPGGGATHYPDKLGIEVQPGRPLIVQMHYNTVAAEVPGEDSTQIDLQVQADGITPGVFTQILDLEMNLPPGDKDAREIVAGNIGTKLQKSGPLQIYGVFPHMHELGRTQRFTYEQDGKESCLVDVPRYDFHWQRMYFYDKPIEIDAHTPLKLDCRFDTTTRSEVTKWGESTQDEMCVMGVFIKL